jgi:hypothetical protein
VNTKIVWAILGSAVVALGLFVTFIILYESTDWIGRMFAVPVAMATIAGIFLIRVQWRDEP